MKTIYDKGWSMPDRRGYNVDTQIKKAFEANKDRIISKLEDVVRKGNPRRKAIKISEEVAYRNFEQQVKNRMNGFRGETRIRKDKINVNDAIADTFNSEAYTSKEIRGKHNFIESLKANTWTDEHGRRRSAFDTFRKAYGWNTSLNMDLLTWSDEEQAYIYRSPKGRNIVAYNKPSPKGGASAQWIIVALDDYDEFKKRGALPESQEEYDLLYGAF